MNKHIPIIMSLLLLSACAHDPYHLKVDSSMAKEHGQSIYFRSNMRSVYAGQIRRVLAKKFGEIGMKTATSTENADFIGIFDVETLYADSGVKSYGGYNQKPGDTPLFTDAQDGRGLDFSGNENLKVDKDKTCFTLKIGRKNTSKESYSSSFCADAVEETEEMLPKIVDIYTKYGTYEKADIGVQCLSDTQSNISCDVVHDRQKAFLNSLWISSEITDE